MTKRIVLTFIVSSLLVLTSCEKYFGDKTDLDFIEIPKQNFREVAYVPVQPVLDQFARPTDVLAGFDELIYVVDNGTEEIIALDQSGREVGRLRVPGVISVTQDRKLDLLAIGTKDTVLSGTPYKLTAIYRIDLSTPLGYGLKFGRIVNTITHPFYIKISGFVNQDAAVKFNRIAVMGDNSYYVTRQGPINTTSGARTPDDAILLFNANDQYITPITITANDGRLFKDYFKKPYGITTYAKPPQITSTNNRDFIFTSIDDNTVLKTQLITFIESDFGSQYTPVILPVGDFSEADGFLYSAFKFSEPLGTTITGDGTNYIFVADAEKDSIFQFTNTGFEGVNPPPASGETRFVKTSFGGTGLELTQFREPVAVAHARDILYVADRGNGRVLRFKLTLDIR
tara:strand:- start:3580 stop:4776 length:1197 start_codon:yes stop_codon:yes gene_type:complete